MARPTMSIPQIVPEESTRERPVQAGWWQQFWWRYSPHGELPLSSAASWVIHALLAVLVWVATMTVASRYREPPRVDVVSVGDGNSTGPAGGGDGVPVGGDGNANYTTESERLNR